MLRIVETLKPGDKVEMVRRGFAGRRIKDPDHKGEVFVVRGRMEEFCVCFSNKGAALFTLEDNLRLIERGSL